MKNILIKLILFKWRCIYWAFLQCERYKNWWLKILGAEEQVYKNRVRKPVVVISSEEREKAAETREKIKNQELKEKLWE